MGRTGVFLSFGEMISCSSPQRQWEFGNRLYRFPRFVERAENSFMVFRAFHKPSFPTVRFHGCRIQTVFWMRSKSVVPRGGPAQPLVGFIDGGQQGDVGRGVTARKVRLPRGLGSDPPALQIDPAQPCGLRPAQPCHPGCISPQQTSGSSSLAGVLLPAEQSFHPSVNFRAAAQGKPHTVRGRKKRLALRQSQLLPSEHADHPSLACPLQPLQVHLALESNLPFSLILRWKRVRFDEWAAHEENRRVVYPSGPVAQFGSALPWHGRGRRFDPDQVHQLNQTLRKTFPFQLGSNLAANFQRPAKTASCFVLPATFSRSGLLALKFRTLALFTGSFGAPGLPFPPPSIFCVSSW